MSAVGYCSLIEGRNFKEIRQDSMEALISTIQLFSWLNPCTEVLYNSTKHRAKVYVLSNFIGLSLLINASTVEDWKPMIAEVYVTVSGHFPPNFSFG